MKNLKRVFSEKNELQLQWISIMFARFLNVRIPKCYVAADTFSNKFYLFSSRRDQNREKNWRSWKKFNYWPLSSEILTDLWFQLSRKIENSQTRWHPSHVIQKPQTTLQCYVAADIISNKLFYNFFRRKILIIDREYYVRGKSAHRKWRHWAQEPI